MTKIEFLRSVVVRDASTGGLTSFAKDQIVEVGDTLAEDLVGNGYAQLYTLITPSGNKAITENGSDIDVTEYATVSVNVVTTGK